MQVGEKIKSRNLLTGLDDAKTVTATIKRFAPAVVTVSVTDAKTGQVETLTCTPEHPFFVSGQGWVEAGSLGIGTSIVSRAGPALSVTNVTWHRDQSAELAAGIGSTQGGFTVYNLTVEDDHTFFVGTVGGGTWVHNIGCYTEASDAHVNEAGHSAESPYQEGQSKFNPGEGGQPFTDEVTNHPDAYDVTQDDGRTRWTVDDLGRRPVGIGEGGLPARGGTVVLEGDPPVDPINSPGDVVTQYPN